MSLIPLPSDAGNLGSIEKAIRTLGAIPEITNRMDKILDSDGIAVRAGHHCAMPLHDKFGLPATTRASFYIYNTPEEVDRLAIGLEKVMEFLG